MVSVFHDAASDRCATPLPGCVALVTALVCTGCATFGAGYRAECSWFEVESQPALTASGQRQLGHDHVGPHQCGSTDLFVISRAGYTVEAWNSDWYTPVLFLRITGDADAELSLDGQALERTAGGRLSIPPAEQKYPYAFRAHHWVDGQAVPRAFPFTLDLRILNRSGEEVARERLTIVTKKGYFFFRDAL
jgi:hypothetical protein